MKDWKESQHRKVHQRAINKLMRSINRAIEKDELWKGRYCIRQYKAEWVPWDNTNDYFLCVQFILHDKKTGKTHITSWKDSNDWLFLGGSKLWWEMNDFIIDSGVWQENPRPTYENTLDFRNKTI